MYIKYKHKLQFAIWTKRVEFFELNSKEKANFFSLIKLLFIKVRCLRNVNKICGLLRDG